MSKITDAVQALFPGIPLEDAYDDNYPDGVAGHVSAGPRIDTAESHVRTPFGIDHAFTGADIDHDAGHRPEMAGEAATDAKVKEAVGTLDAHKTHRMSTSQAADGRTNCGNMTLANTRPVRILRANRNRRAVKILCVSGGPAFVGTSMNIDSTPSPDTDYLPNGIVREFNHGSDVVIVGPANAVVSWTEENYLP